MTVPHLLLLSLALLAAAGGAVLWVCAVVSVLRTATALRAAVWVVLTLAFPVVGPVAWFLVGHDHEQRLSADGSAAGPAALAH
ncbi:PLD nuclease N-terminal domain-containing protein [Microlunatus flavus]|uniref:Phospholipase_D-nuclease N-terminal n=1 Tax=Microlunatus flavus TaxID=1036181 RepID=A0A1H9C0T4_9ACTN|nr:PLD nuclease N-terminal domain-containing protein [Microlunatus flavus]SEP94393.1 Phospholipase_D-nuclease N-terminal [Microlunatus flavus]